ncbi:uncharacterized protein LOC112948352 isoform X2 [Nothoprocta perdicaria]|uniref:uncharacterized protein LOC112948352 isoform X2 n=1 Tax=Nothoprocta perdicaria TaxID=30464 RepID=UPI000E1C24A4|nr:uncharacterized protein LOC112948352 isoform X2 [Nothoprocta perdicaria]
MSKYMEKTARMVTGVNFWPPTLLNTASNQHSALYLRFQLFLCIYVLIWGEMWPLIPARNSDFLPVGEAQPGLLQSICPHGCTASPDDLGPPSQVLLPRSCSQPGNSCKSMEKMNNRKGNLNLCLWCDGQIMKTLGLPHHPILLRFQVAIRSCIGKKQLPCKAVNETSTLFQCHLQRLSFLICNITCCSNTKLL